MKTYGVGKGIAEDIRGRIPWYSHDWVDGWSYGIRLALATVNASRYPLLFLIDREYRDSAPWSCVQAARPGHIHLLCVCDTCAGLWPTALHRNR